MEVRMTYDRHSSLSRRRGDHGYGCATVSAKALYKAKLNETDYANKPNTQVRLQGVRIYERLEQNQNIHSVLHERRHNNKATQGIVDHMASNMSNCKQPAGACQRVFGCRRRALTAGPGLRRGPPTSAGR